MKYIVEARVEMFIEVEADSEEEASEKAREAPLKDWQDESWDFGWPLEA